MSNAKQLHTLEVGTHYLNDLMVRAVLFEDKPGDIEEINALVKPLGLSVNCWSEYNENWVNIGKMEVLRSGNEVFETFSLVNKGEYLVKCRQKLFTMSKEAFETLFTETYVSN